jgi:hypothetical protein
MTAQAIAIGLGTGAWPNLNHLTPSWTPFILLLCDSGQ